MKARQQTQNIAALPGRSEETGPTRAPHALREALLHLLYPPRCRNCERPLRRDDGIRICDLCWGQVERLGGDFCSRCGHPLSDLNPERGGFCRRCPVGPVHFDTVRSAVAYGGAVKSLVIALKFQYQEHVAEFLAHLLVPVWEEEFADKVDLIIPVPLYWTRRRWREFNQSALLARRLGAHTGVPVREDVLRRVRRTRPQSRTTGQARKRRNVRGAFRAAPNRAPVGSRVLLVDDVFTSGNTVNECARALKEAGADRVHVLTVARAVGSEPDA